MFECIFLITLIVLCFFKHVIFYLLLRYECLLWCLRFLWYLSMVRNGC
jgi:hypothetical protein